MWKELSVETNIHDKLDDCFEVKFQLTSVNAWFSVLEQHQIGTSFYLQ